MSVFFARAPEKLNNEIQTKMETRRASQTILPTVPQAQREAAFE